MVQYTECFLNLKIIKKILKFSTPRHGGCDGVAGNLRRVLRVRSWSQAVVDGDPLKKNFKNPS